MSSVIELKQITKSYIMGDTEQQVLKGVDLQINAGEILAIIGASGSGKSTIMNTVGLLDRPNSGEYFLNGKEVSDIDDNERAEIRNKMIGFVFQSFFLLPRFNALQNVGLPLRYRNTPANEIHERSMAMLEKVGMADRAKHRPGELSGGQQQRVAIARALVGEPTLILGDEPTGALDTSISQEVMDLFLGLNQESKTTLIIITHDSKVADQCERVVRVIDGMIEN